MHYLKNKNYISIDVVLETWLLFFVLIQFRLHLFEIQSRIIAAIISLALFFVYLISQLTKKTNRITALFFGVAFIFILLLNFVTSAKTHLLNNLVEIIIPLSLLLYFGSLLSRPQKLNSFFKAIILPLNIYLIINSLILYLQFNGATNLLDTTYYSDLSYDYYSGLLGGNDGTHRLTLLVSFLLILNIHYFGSFSLNGKIFNLLLFAIGFAATTYFSTQNDNVAYFVYVPFTLLIYFLIKVKSLSGFAKSFYKPLIIVGLFYGVVSLLVKNETTGFGKIINRLNETVFSYGFINEKSSMGPDERTRLFTFSLENGGLFGRGIGSIKMLAEPSISLHFGMASIQSLVYMIGFIPFLLYLVFVSVYFSRFSSKKLYSFVLLFCFAFLSSYFSQVLTVFNTSILFVFTLCFLGMVSISNQRNQVNLYENTSCVCRSTN